MKQAKWELLHHIKRTTTPTKDWENPLVGAYRLSLKNSLLLYLTGVLEDKAGFATPKELHEWWTDYQGNSELSSQSTNETLAYLRDTRRLVRQKGRGKWGLTEEGWWAFERIREWFLYKEETPTWID